MSANSMIIDAAPHHPSPPVRVLTPSVRPLRWGTREGLAAARARRRVSGRPTVATEETVRAAGDLLPDPGRSITSIDELLGVSPATLCNHIPDLRQLRAGAVPRQFGAPAK